MVKHSSPCLAPARERSGLEAAGYFLSKQAPVPFQPQPACPSCCSVGWRWPLGLGKHSHDLPQGAGLSPSDTAAPCPLFLRQQQRWPAETGCEQVWEEAFRQLKQLLSASSQKKNNRLESSQTCRCDSDSFFPASQQWQPQAHAGPSKSVLPFSTCWTAQDRAFQLTLLYFAGTESTALSIFTSKLN